MDTKYGIADDEHIRELRLAYLMEVGSMLSVLIGGRIQWMELACKLGLSNGDIQRIEAMVASNYGYEVLRLWSLRDGSTIRVLITTLMEMSRDDVLQKLKEFQRSKSESVQ